MNELVERLASGQHPVVVGGSTPSAADLHQRINDFGYVFIKFLDTRGGTDLGVRVDHAATILDHADFAHTTGTVHIEGALTLNAVPVRCIADIELATLAGNGHLIVSATA